MSNYPWGLATTNITASKTATQEWTKTWVTGQNYATQAWVEGKNYTTQTQLAKKRNLGDMGAGGSPEDSNSWFIINGARLDYSNGNWTNGTYTISIDEIDNNSINYQIAGPNHLLEFFTLDDDFTATVTNSESGDEYFIVGYTDTIATTTYAVKNDGGVAKVKSMTQAAYDALVSPDATTLYVIPEEV